MTLPLLKACPFCGNTPDSSNPAIFQLTDGCKYGAVVCCIKGPEVRTDYKAGPHWHREAAEAWNERAEQLPEVVVAATRYEFVRTLPPVEFARLWQENLAGGPPFDVIVDREIASRAAARASDC